MLDKWSLRQQWNQLHITDKEDEIGTIVRKEGQEAPQEVNCRTIIYPHNPILWVPPTEILPASHGDAHLSRLAAAPYARIKTHTNPKVSINR